MSTNVSLISDLNAELVLVRNAKTAALKNGQKHSLNGSHSIDMIPYSDLIKRENQILSALAKLNGAASSTLPDFSGGTARITDL